VTAAVDLDKYRICLETLNPVQVQGKVTQVVGLVVAAAGPACRLGAVCDIFTREGGRPLVAEAMGFREQRVLLMPLEEIRGIGPGCRVVARQQRATVRVGSALLGRVIDGLGAPIDGKGPVEASEEYPLYASAVNPLRRRRIHEPLDLGIRAINGLLTVGCGQRIGVFAGSGVGKSVLLGMIARKTAADVNVIALIGERGREVREFLEEDLGAEGLARSVVIAVTSAATALEKVKGAEAAFTVAEHFRDEGRRVLLMVDSLTRYAMALREIGLAAGEPPATKGYTPSVFAALPRLLERAGMAERGSITGLFTVLVEGDDMTDPVADAVRAILDGHVVLSRKLAMAGLYPAVDVLASVSRLAAQITPPEELARARELIAAMALYQENEDLVQIGAYQAGSSPELDRAIALRPRWLAFLRQAIGETSTLEETRRALAALLAG